MRTGRTGPECRQVEKIQEREKLDSATAIYNLMHPLLQDEPVEQAWLLLMNHNFKLFDGFTFYISYKFF